MIKAVNNYVVVELADKAETRLKMLDTQEISTQRWATVKSVGPGHPDMGGGSNPLPVAPDDLVYCMAHGLYDVGEVSFVSEFDIMGKATIDLENKKITKFTPLGNLILVEPEDKETRTSTGLVMPDKAQDPVVRGVVKEVGTGWKNLDGTDIPFHVKPTDQVYFLPDRLMKVRGDLLGLENDMFLVSHADIVGVEA